MHKCTNTEINHTSTMQKKKKKNLFNIVPFLDQMTSLLLTFALFHRANNMLSSGRTTNAPLMAIILLSAVSHCGWHADTQSHLACRAEIPQPQLNWILKCGVCVCVRSSVGVRICIGIQSVFICVHAYVRSYLTHKTYRCQVKTS